MKCSVCFVWLPSCNTLERTYFTRNHFICILEDMERNYGCFVQCCSYIVLKEKQKFSKKMVGSIRNFFLHKSFFIQFFLKIVAMKVTLMLIKREQVKTHQQVKVLFKKLSFVGIANSWVARRTTFVPRKLRKHNLKTFSMRLFFIPLFSYTSMKQTEKLSWSKFFIRFK